MEGWQTITLGEVCKFTGGNGFREELQGRKDGDYPFIKVSDMELPDNKKTIIGANNWIDEKTRLKEALKTFPKDSVVFAKVGAALLLNRRRILTRPTCIDNNLMAALPTGIDPLFLFYKLSAIDFSDFVQSGAVPSINQSQISSISFGLPEPIEQIKIAEILSTVDRAIEQTEAIIAKQQRIKTGLMQDLLTRGIDEHGNIRSEETHEFKDSPLGRIPVEWDVKIFEDITPTDAPIGYGIVQPGAYDFAGVRVAGIYTINSDFHRWHMSSRKIEQAYVRSRIRSCDVLLSIKGTTGRVGVVPGGIVGNISREIARIRPIATINPHFLRFLMLSDFFQQYLGNTEVGTTRAEISIKILRMLYVLIPPRAEQDIIVCGITSIEQVLESGYRELNKLHSLKTALLQDLLTGKVRATPLLSESQEASA